MRATNDLSREHRYIERVLLTLADLAKAPAEATPGRLGDILAFLREYADELHHGKEEKVLFAAMSEHGFPMDDGPLAVMMYEHGEGRAFIASMATAQAQARPWSPEVIARFQEAARGYVSLLRMHIGKEDNVLYRLADAHLPESVKDEIARKCQEMDAAHEQRRARFEDLAQRPGISS